MNEPRPESAPERADDPARRRAALVAADKRHVWHPYTPMQRYLDEVDPFVVERAAGARFYDVDGRSYLDGNSSWWVATLGHAHPRLVARLRAQAGVLPHVSLAGVTHEPAARLAEELVAVAPPGLERVFYSDNGSTAIEVAIKMALQYFRNTGAPERDRFVALEGAFHGETLGPTSLSGIEVFRHPFGSVVFDCLRVPSPAAGGMARAFTDLEAVLAGGKVAAVVLEPVVQGVAGMRFYDPTFLRRARAACDATGTLLVLDEVFTGYGRLGPMWAAELAGVAPDLLCLAKGFTGGMLPMAATLASRRVFDAFLGDPRRALYYGHSYAGNPLGAAVAREVLAVYRDEDVLGAAARTAAKIATAFEIIGRIDGAVDARARGCIGAVDLAPDAGYLGARGWKAFEEARRLGAYLRPLGDVVYVAPPLTIPEADLDELLGIVEASVRHALR